MGFLRWVGDHLKRVAHTPAAIIDAVHRTITVLWHVLTALGTVVRTAWGVMLTGAKDFASWAELLAGYTYVKLRELFTVTIPHAITHVLAEAWRRAGGAIDELRTWAKQAEAYVLHYAARIVADLRGWASSAVSWLTGHVGDLLTRMGRVERRVFALLDRPDHMAEWLFGALFSYALRTARRYEKALARWLVGNAVALIMRSVPEIESVVADLF